MKEEDKKTLLNLRRQKARDALKDAILLFENKSLSSSVNRIYYALFYEASALLLTKGMSSSKHGGAKALFHQHFVKTGMVSKEMGKFYSATFEFRQKGDYDDFVEFEEDKVSEWIKKAEEFLDALDKAIETEMESGDNDPSP